ncbi:MAG: hypothetical protein WEB58_21245 [Planctomycetaceae bacterium]
MRRYYGLPAILFALFAISSTPCTAQEMDYPLAVAAAEARPIYIADRHLPGIWKFEGDELSMFFQGSKKFRTPLNAVRCVALDHKGRLLAGDTSTRQVYRFDDSGQPVPLLTTKTGIGMPMALVADAEGNIFICDLELRWIWKLAPDSTEPVKYAEVAAPRGIALDADGRLWCVSGGTKNQLVRVETDGTVNVVVKEPTFEFPHQVVLDDEKTAYVTDSYAKAVWRIPLDGTAEKWISGAPLANPVGIARQGKDLLIADPRAKAIFRIDAEGEISRVVPPG